MNNNRTLPIAGQMQPATRKPPPLPSKSQVQQPKQRQASSFHEPEGEDDEETLSAAKQEPAARKAPIRKPLSQPKPQPSSSQPKPKPAAAVASTPPPSIKSAAAQPKYNQPVATPRKAPTPGTPAAAALDKLKTIPTDKASFKIKASSGSDLDSNTKSTNVATAKIDMSTLPPIQERYTAQGIATAAASSPTNNNHPTSAVAQEALAPVKQALTETATALSGGRTIHLHVHSPIHLHIYNNNENNNKSPSKL